jgi:hypothetical protein
LAGFASVLKRIDSIFPSIIIEVITNPQPKPPAIAQKEAFDAPAISPLTVGPGTTDPPQPKPAGSINQQRPPMMTPQ